MTVSNTTNRIAYTGNGSTTEFAFPNLFFVNSDLKVYVNGVLQTSGYSVSGAGSASGGTVTFGSAPAAEASVVIVSDPDLLQSTKLPSNGPFPSVSVEKMSDKSTLQIQRMSDRLDRAAGFPDSYAGSASPLLPIPGAGYYLRWNAAGTALEAVASVANSDSFLNSGVGAIARAITARLAERVSVLDFGATGTATLPATNYMPAIGHDDTAGIQAALTAAAGRTVYIPFVPGTSGFYRITAPLTWPNNQAIILDPGVALCYDDTLHPSTFCLTNGTDLVRGGGLYSLNLRIELRTPTARGLDIFNCVGSTFDNTYIAGTLTPGWDAASVPQRTIDMTARDTVGLRIRMHGAENFWNVFNRLWINHCHTAIQIPYSAGVHDVCTQQIFNGLFIYGDSNYYDTQGAGIVAQTGQYSVVNGGYVEAYDDGAFGGVLLQGSNAYGWRINDVIFDNAPGISMNAIVCDAATGIPGVYPGNNVALGCNFVPGLVSIVDNAPAANGNFWENNPTLPGISYTTTLRCATSGTITLTAGKGGNVLYIERRGRNVKFWGLVTVASVSAPLGRLFMKLPVLSMNDNANYSSPSIAADMLQATATTAPQASITRNTDEMEITFFAAGAASTTAAAQFKAGSFFYVSGEYVAKEIV